MPSCKRYLAVSIVNENDEIMVSHDFMSYPDDTREAVMLVALLKDGQIIRMETGATLLDQGHLKTAFGCAKILSHLILLCLIRPIGFT